MVAKWDSTYMPSLNGKIAIVTGANSGIGFCTAMALARKNAHVILACRNEALGTQAEQDVKQSTGNDKVEFMKVDMGSLDSIRVFSQKFHAKFERLDLLINNAGVMFADFEATSDGFEAHFGVNHLGPFYLTTLLFDLLKASPAARVVGLSSVAHYNSKADFSTHGFPNRDSKMTSYGISKLAVNLFTFELQRRLQAAGIHNIKAVTAHPGVSLTNLLHLRPWVKKVANVMTSCILQDPENAALPSLFAATEESIEGGEFIGPSGFQEYRGTPARLVPSRESRSEDYAIKLWKRSEELVHAEFVVE